jgi:thiamine pyrophosphate-dependent acetolactate synthase large subunit-like protein
VWSGAREALMRLGDATGALLGTTMLAKGLFDGSPWNLGVVGGFSSPAARELIRGADAVLAFGAELGHFTSQAETLFLGRSVVRVDNAPFSGAAPDRCTLALEADARETAEVLCAALAGLPGRTGFRTAETQTRLAALPAIDSAKPGDGLIDPRALMLALGAAIPAGARIVVGGGHFFSFPCLYLRLPERGAFFCPLGAAAVGQALPFAIGVGMAAPDRAVVAIEGDGSLLMNIQELDTAARHRLPIVLLLMNDGALSAEAIRLRLEGYDANLAVYPTPDFVAIARGFGWQAITIREAAPIADLVRAHRWHEGPLLIDARISREIVVDPVAVKDLSHRLAS